MKVMFYAVLLALSMQAQAQQKESEVLVHFANVTETEPTVTEWFKFPINTLKVSNLTMNTSDLELGGVLSDGKFYFTSDRYDEMGLKFSRKQDPHLDLFEASIDDEGEISFAKRVQGDINSILHEGFCSFSKDGKTMYFSRNERDGMERVADNNNVSHLKVCSATKIDGRWTDVYELDCNLDGYSISHPAVSADGNKLFFSGVLPGGLGGKDLWYSELRSDGTWGKPKNLGPEINTEEDECYPYIAHDGSLFFTSDGHPGFGGLDIFRFNHLNPTSPIEIMPEGINSKYDDFSFYYDVDTKRGFFSSDRSKGKGGDDIYQFKFLDRTGMVH